MTLTAREALTFDQIRHVVEGFETIPQLKDDHPLNPSMILPVATVRLLLDHLEPETTFTIEQLIDRVRQWEDPQKVRVHCDLEGWVTAVELDTHHQQPMQVILTVRPIKEGMPAEVTLPAAAITALEELS